MKKMIMALALMASMFVMGSVDVYTFKSNMHVYNLAKKCYVTTTFNGTMTVDTDSTNQTAVIEAYKKDTKETFTLTLTGDDVMAIVSGKKNTVGAAYGVGFLDEDDRIGLCLSGNGTAKTVTTGCGPCGGQTSCTKIKSLTGAFIGKYDCGCGNGQHYVYDGSCELPEERESDICPIWGTWSVTLKTVDGAKYK